MDAELEALLKARSALRERLIAAIPDAEVRFAAIISWIPMETLYQIAELWEKD